MLRLRATASIARTCRRSLLQQHQNSRSLFSASALSSSKLDKLLPQVEDFPSRHIGPRRHDAKDMLRVLGYNVSLHVLASSRNLFQHFRTLQSLDELTDAAVPPNIKLDRTMHLENPYSEFQFYSQ